ncbi:hypothetical protein BKA58DRAFT_373776 [Alternaria rosae]|uniref:uncharacterized protein n=1 Tax=Alternaria rosae TaxID=1187941 RepID=UPI001E8CEEE0|nr:uncharacterized protein BKA58DRAFT_373776 [Alternaria rosae]KAH6882711.1 hypothetical protein BKA58DRAFT_373776 [Alternaria rosae]
MLVRFSGRKSGLCFPASEMRRSRLIPRGGFLSALGLRSSFAMIGRHSFAPTKSTISENRPFVDSKRLREFPVAAPIWLCLTVVRLKKGGQGTRTICISHHFYSTFGAQCQGCFCNRHKTRGYNIGRHPATVPKQGKGRMYAKRPNCLKMDPEPGEADCEDERRCRQHHSRIFLEGLVWHHEGDGILEPSDWVVGTFRALLRLGPSYT